jgi:Ser/Thr protein kinase RdoA (MazF antagonist)
MATGGRTNLVYLFKDYVVRLHNPSHAYRTADYLSIEVRVLKHLHSQGFLKCPKVIPADSGSPFFTWNNPETGTTGTGIVTERFSGHSLPPGDPKRVQSVARTLAEAHKLLRELLDEGERRIVQQCKRGFEDVTEEGIVAHAREVLEVFKKELPYGEEESQAWVGLMEGLLALGDRAPASPLPQGIIHLDLNQSNWLWEEDEGTGGEVVALLDWDFVNAGTLLLDCAFALVEWCHDGGKSKGEGEGEGEEVGPRFEPAWVEIFMDAYHEVRPLEEGERRRKEIGRCIGLVWLRSGAWMLERVRWEDEGVREYGRCFVRPILEQIIRYYLGD